MISGTTFCHYHKLGKFLVPGGSATPLKKAMVTCIGSSPAAPLPETVDMHGRPTFESHAQPTGDGKANQYTTHT